jgi:TonB family protein
MALAQKPPKPTPAPPTSTATEVQKKAAKLREQQAQEETATEAQQKVAKLRTQQAQQDATEQKVASLRAEQTEKQAAQQRLAALRAKVGSGGGAGEGNGGAGGTGTSGSGPGSGAAGSGVGGGAPGGGRGTGTTGAGGIGTGGLSGIRLRNYQAELQAKITNAWNIPSQSKGLQASVFLVVSRSGQVEQARLVQGSGNALFDESLQRAIKQAQPLASLPEDYAERSLEVTLRFRGRG